MKFLISIFLMATGAALAQPAPTTPPAKHPFTFEDMMSLKRVGEPAPSPDGKWIVFAAEDVDLEANTKISHLWIVPATGGEARRLNQSSNGEERPRFSPGGRRLIFTSKATDPPQIWVCDFSLSTGSIVGQPRQLTNISTGADGGIWSPDGRNVVFVSSVYPDCSDDTCNKQRDEELKKSKVKAKIFSRLFYRHWKAFTEFKRSHLFVANVGQVSNLPYSEPRDLTPGDHDVPPFSLGGQDMYAISPDGQEVAYTSNIDEVEATSTNNEIFVVPLNVEQVSALPSGNSQVENLRHNAAKKISTSPGSDSTPLYSPDGQYIAWRSQARAGFESDKWRLLICDRMSGDIRDLTKNFDRSIGSFVWSPDSKVIWFSAEDHGESPICSLPLQASQPTEVARLHADDLAFGANGNLFFTRMSIAMPNEIWRLESSQKGQQAAAVTHMNDALLSQIDMSPLESFKFKGGNDEDVEGFLVKPPGFDPAKKYPLKFLIHGGPEGAWGDSWTYRWNAELFAEPRNVRGQAAMSWS